MTLLVVLEHDRGDLADASLEALTAGRGLAAANGWPMHAVIVGANGENLASDAAKYGAEVSHVVGHDMLVDFGPEAWGESVAQLARSIDAGAVMASGTERGNEVLAQIAARLDEPFVANCVTVTPGDPWEITRVQWGGSLLEDTTLVAGMKLLTYGHHSLEPSPADSAGDGSTIAFTPELDATLARTIVQDRTVLTKGVTLATAPVVVSGGRGVGSAEGFGPLEELAELLGGRVGCSRAVTNNGWRPHSDQVGQTGTRIAPEIYIATGISGAIQHWVGAMASKNILAINTDAEANMVVKAGHAVIADLHQVVPAIIDEVKKRKGLA